MIIWIASYPGSGSAVLRAIFKSCLGTESYSKGNDKADTGHRAYGGQWEDFYEAAHKSSEIFLVDTHEPPTDDSKAVFLTRDPRAALVSYHGHLGEHLGAKTDRYDTIFGATPFGSWGDHYDAWAPDDRENTLCLSFEDLLQAPAESTRKLATFTGRPLKTEPPCDFSELQSISGHTFNQDPNAKNISTLTESEDNLIKFLFKVQMQKAGYTEVTSPNEGTVIKAILQISKSKWDLANKLSNQASQADTDTLLAEVNEQNRDAQTLISKHASLLEENRFLRNQYLTMSEAVAPRWKTIFTLKPIRYILKQRQLIKAGHLQLDEHDLPVLQASKIAHQPDASTDYGLPEKQKAQITVQESDVSGSIYADHKSKSPLGIAVFTFDRVNNISHVLESLRRQGAMEQTHVWIDGDQGNPNMRAALEKTFQAVSKFPVHAIHRNRGNYGFRKMMIVAMRKMFEEYDRVLFLEDDCFPTRFAVRGFSAELDKVEQDPSIVTVYGHPFLTGIEETGPHSRFQGWGWASTREKLAPLLEQLQECYLLSEEEYLEYVKKHLTDDLVKKLDVTPGRQPTSTLRRFFAWDEVLGFLAAKDEKTHLATKERLIFNFGVGDGSTHFSKVDGYREPPFNMVTADEIWGKY